MADPLAILLDQSLATVPELRLRMLVLALAKKNKLHGMIAN